MAPSSTNQHAPMNNRIFTARNRFKVSAGTLLTLIVLGAMGVAYSVGDLQFLWDTTAWQMGFAAVAQSPSDPYWKTISIAILNTVVVAAVSITVATALGSLIAFITISGNALWARLARAYVQFFRNMPLILQALFWFAVISHLPAPRQAAQFMGVVASNRGVSVPFLTAAGQATAAAALLAALAAFLLLRRLRPFQGGRTRKALGIGLIAGLGTYTPFAGAPLYSIPTLQGFNFDGGVHLPTELISILIAMSLFGSAYIAEIVRGGFATVPKGVIEAARALAVPPWVIETKIRIPLAMRAAILPIGSQYTTLIKATSVGLAVGFTDLFAVTLMSINQSGHTVPLLCVMTACFVILNQAVVSIANALNHAFEIPGFSAN